MELMLCQFSLRDALAKGDVIELMKACPHSELLTKNLVHNLKKILQIVGENSRFDNGELDGWVLVLEKQEESNEIRIYNEQYDLTCIIVDDLQEYSEEELVELFGIDVFYIYQFDQLLQDEQKIAALLDELDLWSAEFHEKAIEHLKAITQLYSSMITFKDAKDVTLTFDKEEIFLGRDDFDENKNYNLRHEDFDPEDPEESLKQGVGNLTEFEEEYDDWEDDDLDEDDDDSFDF